MEAGRMVRIRMTKSDRDEFMPFKIQYVPLELLRDDQPVRNQARKTCLPETQNFGRDVGAHDFDDFGRRDRSRMREALEKSADSEPMVSVTMRDVNGRQVLALRRNPIRQCIGLLDRHEGIDENGVALAMDEC